MKFTHKNKGTCSLHVEFELNEGTINNISFKGGCDGNLKAISLLSEGRDAREIAKLLRGTKCGFKATSCADQLAKAIEDALNQ